MFSIGEPLGEVVGLSCVGVVGGLGGLIGLVVLVMCAACVCATTGVFTGAKDEEKPLYMKREKLTQEHQRFTILVDEQPTRAGIDPYNKLIDRIADDNMIDVTKQ